MRFIKKNCFTTLLFSFILSGIVYGQYDQVWIFGNKAGIDFTSNPPQPIMSSMIANEGSASVSDINGQLLFYTEGTVVWNRNHVPMTNGGNLTGLSSNITASSSQGSLIVPMPGSLTKYYIFSMGCHECNQLGRLSYKIVDMSLDGGLGDVIPNSGAVLDYTLTEHLTAVAGNNCDIWLITLSRQNNGQFHVYNITGNGINTTPVVSPTIPSILSGANYNEMRGYIDVSPNRTKLATAKSNLTLYDFDASTGNISNPVTLINTLLGCYGVTFSPNNSLLYVQDVSLGSANNYGIQQFDLTSNNAQTILNSENTIATFSAGVPTMVLNGAIKRAPDGKIYCARRASAGFGNSPSYLAVINQPNIYGSGCNFILDGFLLNGGTRSTYGLPNTNSNIFDLYKQKTSYSLICGNYQLSASHTNGAGYHWQDGTQGATRIIDSAGTYWVKYLAVDSQCVTQYIDSFKVLDHQWTRSTSSITSESCWGDTVLLSANLQSGTNYIWQDGTTGSEKFVTESGNYWVQYHEIGNECSNYIDSFLITIPQVNNKVSFNVDSFICQNETVLFLNQSPDYFDQFYWFLGTDTITSVSSPSHSYSETGTYVVTLIGSHNGMCHDTTSKTIVVDSTLNGRFSVSREQICIGESITFTPDFQWDASIKNMHWTFDNEISFSTFESPVTHAFDRAGSQAASLTTLLRACPDMKHTKTITVHPLPLVDLGSDSTLCLRGSAIALQNLEAHQEGYQYLWSTGETSQQIMAKHHGKYRLTVTNQHGCVNTESVTINKDCYVDIPNAFTPNEDGENDYFFPRTLLKNGVHAFKMKVFNRWGQVIFETQNPDGRGWDGRFNGNAQPLGVYIYLIEVTFKNGKSEQYQGNVTLLR